MKRQTQCELYEFGDNDGAQCLDDDIVCEQCHVVDTFRTWIIVKRVRMYYCGINECGDDDYQPTVRYSIMDVSDGTTWRLHKRLFGLIR